MNSDFELVGVRVSETRSGHESCVQPCRILQVRLPLFPSALRVSLSPRTWFLQSWKLWSLRERCLTNCSVLSRSPNCCQSTIAVVLNCFPGVVSDQFSLVGFQYDVRKTYLFLESSLSSENHSSDPSFMSWGSTDLSPWRIPAPSDFDVV